MKITYSKFILIITLYIIHNIIHKLLNPEKFSKNANVSSEIETYDKK